MVRRAESWKALGLAEELQNKDSVWLKSPERGLRVVEDCWKTRLRKYSGPYNRAHTWVFREGLRLCLNCAGK